MRGKHLLAVGGLALAGVLALAGPPPHRRLRPAQAATTQTFATSQSEFTPGVKNQGWWSPTGFNFDANDNYFVGRSSPGRPWANGPPPDTGGTSDASQAG